MNPSPRCVKVWFRPATGTTAPSGPAVMRPFGPSPAAGAPETADPQQIPNQGRYWTRRCETAFGRGEPENRAESLKAALEYGRWMARVRNFRPPSLIAPPGRYHRTESAPCPQQEPACRAESSRVRWIHQGLHPRPHRRFRHRRGRWCDCRLHRRQRRHSPTRTASAQHDHMGHTLIVMAI